MDTKELIINTSITLFHQKGYLGVGLNEILKTCSISKGSFYHHFPNGKEELLIACLHSLNETITTDMEEIFRLHPSTQKATQAMIEKLARQFDREGTITGYTFSSIVSEMGSLSEPVRNACADTFTKMQDIYASKLESDGFSKKSADSLALTLTATIEGGIMLCLTKKTSDPLTIIAKSLSSLLKVY